MIKINFIWKYKSQNCEAVLYLAKVCTFYKYFKCHQFSSFKKGKISECLQNSQTVTDTFHKNYGSWLILNLLVLLQVDEVPI